MSDQTISIGQQYYKVSQMWQDTLLQKNWNLAIWVAEYEDIEMISSFFEIERTVLGQTDDIYFKFNSIYTTLEEFQAHLWKEFENWFTETPQERYDMHNALIKDGYLKKAFVPNKDIPKNLSNLLSEIERFRASLVSINPCFIIEMAIGMHYEDVRQWFWALLKEEIPKNIRFVTIDTKAQRKIKGFSNKDQKYIVELHPKLHMANAIKNDMKKGAQGQNPNEPSSQFQQTVLELMEVLPSQTKMKPLIQKLLEEAKKMKLPSITATAYLIIAHCYNTIKKPKIGLDYINKGIEATSVIKTSSRPEEWYPLWRACTLFKAAFLMGVKETKEAFVLYETVAEQATKEKDHFYIMEAYRMCATLKMKKKKYNSAFEYAGLALYGGSFLSIDIRRQSTYLYVANVAYNCADHLYKDAQKKKVIIEEHLAKWIGEDWEILIQSKENLNAHYAPLPEEKEIVTQP